MSCTVKRENFTRKALSIILTILMILSLLPPMTMTARAEEPEIGVGDFTITSESELTDADYRYDSGVLTINSSTAMTIANTHPETATTDSIVIARGVIANITLAGVNIECNNSAPILLNDGAKANIILAANSENTLISKGRNYAALQAAVDTTLNISAEEVEDDEKVGKLTAKGYGGAAIGGDQGSDGGNITINSGTITAISIDGAGIGGGGYGGGAGGNITINGGEISAISVEGAAIGDGAGEGENGGNITISGGKIEVTSTSTYGVGIGGYVFNYSILINGGTVAVITNETDGIGIKGDIITIDGGSVSVSGATLVDGTTINSAEASVYLTTLSLTGGNVANKALTAASIGEVAMANTANAKTGVYGKKDVYTDDDGKLYFWLPATTYEAISATTDVGTYDNAEDIVVTDDNASTGELKKPSSSSGSAAPKLSVTPNSDDTYTVNVPKGTENIPLTFKPSKGEKVTAGTVLRITEPADMVGEYIGKSIVNSDGSITFIVDDGVEFEVVQNEKAFDDVSEDDWFAQNVDFTSAREILKGTGDDMFSPQLPVTRAMFATILWRLELMPDDDGDMFADVDPDSYYAQAVIWGQESEVVKGIGEDKFAPDNNIKRQDLATMMFRYAKYLGIDTRSRNSLSDFSDAVEIDEYALDAMKWAVAVGLVEGKSENTIDPQGNATRAEGAAIIQRFIEHILEK